MKTRHVYLDDEIKMFCREYIINGTEREAVCDWEIGMKLGSIQDMVAETEQATASLARLMESRTSTRHDAAWLSLFSL